MTCPVYQRPKGTTHGTKNTGLGMPVGRSAGIRLTAIRDRTSPSRDALMRTVWASCPLGDTLCSAGLRLAKGSPSTPQQKFRVPSPEQLSPNSLRHKSPPFPQKLGLCAYVLHKLHLGARSAGLRLAGSRFAWLLWRCLEKRAACTNKGMLKRLLGDRLRGDLRIPWRLLCSRKGQRPFHFPQPILLPLPYTCAGCPS